MKTFFHSLQPYICEQVDWVMTLIMVTGITQSLYLIFYFIKALSLNITTVLHFGPKELST